MIEELDIPSPPLVEQQSIAAVLGALDDKIELNRRMNATLEAMARALFQSWFVDFDPARAKLDGRTPAALDPTTAALFPDSFQDSPIGPVPKGWKVERFDAHITADRGLSYNGEGLRNDGTGLPMHNLNSIYEGGGYKHEGIKYYQGEYREKHLVEAGDMIVTNTEQGFDRLLIGHAAIVPRCFGPKGIFSHHIYRVRFKPSSPFNPHYLVELFNNRRWHYWISGFSNGTTINMLPIDALEMPLFVVPPKELVMTFTAIAQAARDQIENIIQQSRALATLRNTLLPKLLSGELSVTNAARKES
jgi:type I restriction enzyme S subunit